MTNEEWDRKTEFLLNQQAKFDAGMQELKAGMQELKVVQAISEQKISKVTEKAEQALEAVSQLTDLTTQLINTMTQGFRSAFDRMKRTDENIDALVNSQIHTDERLRDTDKRLRDTDKRLRDTDKRLRVLTDLFKRHIRIGRGHPHGSET